MRVLVVLNAQGRTIAQAGAAGERARVAAAFAEAGIDATVKLVSGGDVAHTVEAAVGPQRSGGPACDAIVIGGGDGSVGTAARYLADSGMPLGILPLGTLNHFAKDLNLPLEIEGAVRVIAAGAVRTVDVGEVNGHVFVNNSSIGIYPYMVADRDRQCRFGRAKWFAMAIALARAFHRFPVHRFTVHTAGGERSRKTPCVFVGNNMYSLDPMALGGRSALDRGELCVYIANSRRRWRLALLIIRVVLGRANQAEDFEVLHVSRAEIRSRSRRLHVALDGELEIMRSPLVYRSRPRALRVFAPAAEIEAP